MCVEIYINGKKEVFNKDITLAELIAAMQLPDTGCVFSVNNSIIPRSLWRTQRLNTGDQISLFQAIAGG